MWLMDSMCAWSAFLLASMNIPNVDNFRSWYYRHIDSISQPIRELTNDLILKARDEEVRATFFELIKEESPELTTDDINEEWLKWKNGDRKDEVGFIVLYDI